MRVQFVHSFLSRISITFLKDAYGPFIFTVHLEELIIAAFLPPGEDFSAKFIPLAFEDIFVRFHAKFSRFIWWDAFQN